MADTYIKEIKTQIGMDRTAVNNSHREPGNQRMNLSLQNRIKHCDVFIFVKCGPLWEENHSLWKMVLSKALTKDLMGRLGDQQNSPSKNRKKKQEITVEEIGHRKIKCKPSRVWGNDIFMLKQRKHIGQMTTELQVWKDPETGTD